MIDEQRFRIGDREHFPVVIREYGSMVLQVASAYSEDQDHAEDLFQDIWEHVYRRCRTYEGPGTLRAWIHRIATNVCRSDYRSRSSDRRTITRFRERQDPTESTWTPLDPLAFTEQRERADRLHRAMAELPERELQVLILRRFDGHSAEEASKIMKCEASTVRSLTRNAINRLRAMMEDRDDDVSRRRSAD